MFKNLTVFTVPELDRVALAQKISNAQFRPCLANDEQSYGFVLSENFNYIGCICTVGSYLFLRLRIDTKLLPKSVVKKAVTEEVKAIEVKEDRKLTKSERSLVYDEVYFKLLAKAFITTKYIEGYIDTERNLLCVDTASAKIAELFVSCIRDGLGSFPAFHLEVNDDVGGKFDHYALNIQDKQFRESCWLDITQQCKIKFESGGSLSSDGLYLEALKDYIDDYGSIVKLSANWQDQLSFVINDKLVISKIKFVGLEPSEDVNADYLIMADTLGKFVDSMIVEFGGLKKS